MTWHCQMAGVACVTKAKWKRLQSERRNMRNVILCDLDHTVSHAAPRDHLLGEWDAYHQLLIEDKLCEDMALVLEAFRVACFYIVGFTARPEKFRGLSQQWLL